jgi:hypothetical protein
LKLEEARKRRSVFLTGVFAFDEVANPFETRAALVFVLQLHKTFCCEFLASEKHIAKIASATKT